MLKKIVKNNFVYNFQPASSKKSKGTILFVHGYATDSHYHDSFASKLKNYDYYSIELPGNGINDKFSKQNYTISFFINYVCEFIKFLNKKDLILIGHSMGGGIAAAVNRIMTNKIKKTILVTPMNPVLNLKLFNLFRFFINSEDSIYKLFKLLYKNPDQYFNKKLKDEISKEYKYQKQQSSNNKKTILSLISIKNVLRMHKDRKNLHSKTLLIVGEYDKIIYYKSAIKAFKNFKDLQIEIFKGSGHLPFIEEQDKYYQVIIDFIEK